MMNYMGQQKSGKRKQNLREKEVCLSKFEMQVSPNRLQPCSQECRKETLGMRLSRLVWNLGCQPVLQHKHVVT
jgi:hypothetical protein